MDKRRTSICFRAEEALLLSCKKAELDVGLEGNTSLADRPRDGEDGSRAGPIIVTAWGAGTPEGAARVVVSAQKDKSVGVIGAIVSTI